jgi:uncharacterized protein YecE (DUF72 family)
VTAAGRGRLYAGTSGFAYPGWVGRFYEPGRASRRLLVAYAGRLPAVELHNTFYRRPDSETVQRWREMVPPGFRFCPKAQRGAAWRAWTADADAAMTWLASSLGGFGDRLGVVLLSAANRQQRDDDALARLLAARPADLPLALELPHPSWAADEVHALLARHEVALVATDRDDRPDGKEPDLRRIGPCLYLRLRRPHYAEADMARWAARLEPFLADGLDAYVFVRHDADGGAALLAEGLLSSLGGDRTARTQA